MDYQPFDATSPSSFLRRLIRSILVPALVLSSAFLSFAQERVPSDQIAELNETTDKCDVLIDTRHAHDFSNYPLTIDDRFYHRIYSFNKAFSRLQDRGVVVAKYSRDVPIDAETLARCKTLFLNLPSGDKSPFFVSEILAIVDFVKKGGSVFFIVDHTNCYFHQSRLAPLFCELDVAPQYYGVCDATQNLGEGFGWIYFNKFTKSPITQGLRQIAFQTGGGVDPRDAVVWSSEDSWQDKAGMPIYGETDLAYFGNFARDEDEPVGSSGAVSAKKFGQGKIVVVGDQNLFSAFFLQYLDNYRLWLNIFAWTLDRPDLADVKTYFEGARKERTLLCWEELKKNAKRFGNPDSNGYYHVYTELCRRYNVFCTANDDSDLGLEADALLWIGGGAEISQLGVDLGVKQLKRGKTLIALDPAKDVVNDKSSGVAKVLQATRAKSKAQNANAETNDAPSLKKRVERFETPTGGRLVLLRGYGSFDNSELPRPEEKLSLFQQENLNALLREIDAALK